MMSWQNPFGTRTVRAEYKYADDSSGKNECDPFTEYYDGAVRGVHSYLNPTTPFNIKAFSGPYVGGIGFKTSGYIGCYAEVLEDD